MSQLGNPYMKSHLLLHHKKCYTYCAEHTTLFIVVQHGLKKKKNKTYADCATGAYKPLYTKPVWASTVLTLHG